MIHYYNPVNIEFGKGSLAFLQRYVQNEKVLLLTSPTFVKNGVVEQIKSDVNVVQVVSTVKPNPTIEDIESIKKMLDYSIFDKIIALGGGSVIDTAKALSPFSKDKELVLLELLQQGFTEITCDFKPIIAIPTTAGTGSEVTMWGTIWDEQNKLKYSIADEKLFCEVAILDPTLHTSLPRELTIQTGLDALSHSLEALWNKNANSISDTYAISAVKIIIETLPLLMNNLNDITLRESMLVASYRAGLAFSSTQTALAHAMSYYMTLHKGVPHGIAASFTLPAIIKVAMKDKNIKAKLQEALGEKPEITLENLFALLNVSTKGTSYDISKDDWINILKSLKNTPRANNSQVNPEEVIYLLMKEG